MVRAQRCSALEEMARDDGRHRAQRGGEEEGGDHKAKLQQSKGAFRVLSEHPRRSKKNDKELTGSLNLTAIHSQQQPRAPIEKGLTDSVSDSLDGLAGHGAHHLRRGGFLFRGRRQRDVFKKDSDALHRFVTEWSLRRC